MLYVVEFTILFMLWLSCIIREVWDYAKGKLVESCLKQFNNANPKCVTEDIVESLVG